MTNLQSIAGGFVWSALATLLMLVAFEPVVVEKPADPQLSFAEASPQSSGTAI